MYTKEAEWIVLINNKVNNRTIKEALYQALINYEIYCKTVSELNENMEKLNLYNFAASQSCHMTEGLFSGLKNEEFKIVYWLKVSGNLITLITAAHRIITCLDKSSKNTSNRTNGLSWKELSIDKCSKVFDNHLRNHMEHLEESVFSKDFSRIDCRFTPERKLCYAYINRRKNEVVNCIFDFSEENLKIIDKLMMELFEMLSNCKSETNPIF